LITCKQSGIVCLHVTENDNKMEIIEIGKLINQPEGFQAFVPNPFPPEDGFAFSPELLKKDNRAARLLGKLDGITELLPDVDFFLLMYLRKDAASSSQIEGTQATIIDAIEAGVRVTEKVPQDVDDILHYIRALNYGINRVTKEDFPVVLRLIRELHKELMHKARTTQYSDPGEFRTSQNWIGGARPDNASFVPPPVADMNRALADLESFIHTEDTIPTIIKAGLVHAQFETIHPFLDGNGRTGRMLITFFLWKEGFLEKPVLFLSSYFKRYQKIYYEKLAAYHNGKVEEWVDFFLDGVTAIAGESIKMADKITALREKDMIKIQSLGKRASESAVKVICKLFELPIVNVAAIQEWTGFSRPGAQTIINRFIGLGILIPKDKDKKYGQSYVYKEYLDIFTGGDE
jgi:Fic family protein